MPGTPARAAQGQGGAARAAPERDEGAGRRARLVGRLSAIASQRHPSHSCSSCIISVIRRTTSASSTRASACRAGRGHLMIIPSSSQDHPVIIPPAPVGSSSAHTLPRHVAEAHSPPPPPRGSLYALSIVRFLAERLPKLPLALCTRLIDDFDILMVRETSRDGPPGVVTWRTERSPRPRSHLGGAGALPPAREEAVAARRPGGHAPVRAGAVGARRA